MIECATLGVVRVSVGGGPAPPELLWRKHVALLVYLARSPHRTRTRDHVVELLWGDRPESAGRHSLNEALRIFRKVAGEQALDASGGRLRLAEGAVALDVDQLERLRRSADWAAASALVGGPFLDGFSLPDASSFEDWLGTERRWWAQRSIEALLHWHEQLVGQARPDLAIEAAERATRLDPDSEPVARALMIARSLAGDPVGAMAHYDAFATGTLERLGAGLSAETDALAERIRRGWRTNGKASRPATIRRAPLIGRDHELRALLECWETTVAGKASVLLIEGDTGTGKSRMLEELRQRAVLGGATTALTRAVEADLAHPHSGLIGLAEGGLIRGPGLGAAANSAIAGFARQLPSWADQYPAARAGAAPEPLDTAFSEIISALLGETPVLLGVDDAHWLDRATLLALGAMLRTHAARPVLVVLAFSRDPASEEIDRLRSRVGRDLAGRIVQLTPLPAPALRELAAWALPGYDNDALDRVTRRIAADSGGFPLLAVEMLNAVSLGLELSDTPPWPRPLATLSDTLPADLPDNAVAAVRVGFRRLSKDAQQALASAAVLGARIIEADLGPILGWEHGRLELALDELEWTRWLASDARGYTFLAGLVREIVARDFLTAGQRRRILARTSSAPA